MITTDERPDVSIVVPVRNAAQWIPFQLEALAEQQTKLRCEVVVADNGSTDSTTAVVESFAARMPSLKVVDASRQVSSNAARNEGVRSSEADVILLADADDVVAPGWIDAMYDGLQSFDMVGGSLDLELLNPPRTLQWRPPYRADGLELAANFLPYAFGGNLGIHRRVWERIGGFDPAWVRGGTEVEFSWRAQLAGFRIGFAPGAVVAYRLPSSDRELFRKIWISARGHPRLYRAFHQAGMPRTRFKTAMLDWAWLAYHLPDLFRGSYERVEWSRRLAWRAGLAAGSLRWRAFYL